ncbi:cell division suppressor protein YneA [Paramaledivibacter caminithermalis]|jgi:nucleoid-associated protein YgaU|uniref:LysM domain-containing protein n=1 Tax=Paramaledivibacter caminithermalis (strain DSM 15212 / CIP 107654 / DViRD3) TaxID=1121301 RepID=A0A1M6JKK0_PARC5|nr:LysM peptidoglycan-binding domain-containing protein [Paramaledivibacter caminithermalis]SHJ47207.1 LysM domain-containing protein [Paramaledivibacter caminithermalis DSM 15212]
MTRLVIVNKKRFMLSTILIMVILFFFVSSILAMINKVEGYQEPKYIEVVVENGDTVWDLAREFSSKDKDVRKAIYEIGIVNNLDSYSIYPGQVLKIPTE